MQSVNTFARAHRRYEPGREVESFYHLRGCDLAGRACDGTACFVARNSRGEAHPSGDPRIYCLGRCFEAPATGLADTRPNIEVHSREAIVLARLAHGGARTLDAYRRSGGYGAVEKARVASTDMWAR